MKCSMTGQEKGDILIQVTAWTGLTICLSSHVIYNCLIVGHFY